jgi:hypothetical protein
MNKEAQEKEKKRKDVDAEAKKKKKWLEAKTLFLSFSFFLAVWHRFPSAVMVGLMIEVVGLGGRLFCYVTKALLPKIKKQLVTDHLHPPPHLI